MNKGDNLYTDGFDSTLSIEDEFYSPYDTANEKIMKLEDPCPKLMENMPKFRSTTLDKSPSNKLFPERPEFQQLQSKGMNGGTKILNGPPKKISLRKMKVHPFKDNISLATSYGGRSVRVKNAEGILGSIEKIFYVNEEAAARSDEGTDGEVEEKKIRETLSLFQQQATISTLLQSVNEMEQKLSFNEMHIRYKLSQTADVDGSPIHFKGGQSPCKSQSISKTPKKSILRIGKSAKVDDRICARGRTPKTEGDGNGTDKKVTFAKYLAYFKYQI